MLLEWRADAVAVRDCHGGPDMLTHTQATGTVGGPARLYDASTSEIASHARMCGTREWCASVARVASASGNRLHRLGGPSQQVRSNFAIGLDSRDDPDRQDERYRP